MSATVQVDGAAALAKKLQRVEDYLAKPGNDSLIGAMRRSVYRLQAEMAGDTMHGLPVAYPQYPGIERSTYRRTGTLGRRWTTKVVRSGDTIEGTLGNNTKYGPLVQSRRFQATIHRRHGWITDADAVNRQRANIEAEFGSGIAVRIQGG